jgi:hypothetical protein
MKNLIQTQINDADWTKIDQAIAEIENTLEGKTVALTEEERVKYGSINEQNKLLVNKVSDFGQNQPALRSPEIDWTAFESDYQTRGKLESRATRLANIVYRMQSTKILHDYDNYQDALDDYRWSRFKKETGDDDYGQKVNELKQFFNRTGKTVSPPPDENE